MYLFGHNVVYTIEHISEIVIIFYNLIGNLCSSSKNVTIFCNRVLSSL